MIEMTKFYLKGQSIIEVIVVTGVLALMLTGLVSVVTLSVSNNRKVKTKTVATRLVQEGVEWVRQEKERLTWADFNIELAPLVPVTFCLDAVDYDWNTNMPAFGSCSDYPIQDDASNLAFGRELLFEDAGDDVYALTVTVYWVEGLAVEQVSAHTTLAKLPN
jgi:type II secretory pathway pseudopilin PulG